MAMEIERKFLVNKEKWIKPSNGDSISQGYLSKEPERTVRIRLRNDKGYLTIKGKNDAEGLSRLEFEYEIPKEDAEAMLKLCKGPILQKTRYVVEIEGHTWEIDEFYGDNEGLLVAEIELSSKNEDFIRPDWILEEVTGDVRYYNSSLLSNPYSKWKK